MTEIILTNRPVELKKPISWVNGITRMKTNGAFDHIAWRENGIVYESTAGKGVHSIPFNEWKKGREGTTIFIYHDLPDNFIDYSVFEYYRDNRTKYDYKANVLFFLNMLHKLEKKNEKRQFCSELVANCISEFMIINGYSEYLEPYKLTPVDIERHLRTFGKLRTETL